MCARQTNVSFLGGETTVEEDFSKWHHRRYLNTHGHSFPGVRSEKRGLLNRKGGHSQLRGGHYHVFALLPFDSCRALWALQPLWIASEWGRCMANGTVHQTISHPKTLGRGVLYREGEIATHVTVKDLSTCYVHLVTSGRFPFAEAFSQCAEP